ncbi:peptidase dimerization domain-containing protein [Hankyongella ginsenosidimutans]|uniref:peptidase dimerization domain-containing protein n=1 Tax=Hankyongella ginsenosidimutans TaxID=1763828 RepID=UPI001FE37DF4|nr:peptidase dimerization domain-containing protein [Hankyongella ginsenosidimutans]
MQQLVSREKSPLEAGVVTVGSIHGGTKNNIIPDQVELLLTVRSNNEAVRAQLLDGIRRIAQNMGHVAGLPEDKLPEVHPPEESTPVTSNDPETARRVKAALVAGLGPMR